ncbi:restriction endonuclease subunit S [Anaeromassilibacillus sp. SJQ-5]
MIARLGDVCEIQSGGTPARSNLSYWEGGTIPWVKISDIKGEYLQITEEFITEEGLQNSSAKIFPKGTILYTIFATLGETCILDIDAATNQAIAGITIKSDNVYREYLYYYLVSLKSAVNRLGRGVAQNNINMGILRNLPIPLPPLDEQRKIAVVLDKVSDLIAKRRQQLDKLDKLVKSRFIELFGDPILNQYGWSKVPLEENATLLNGRAYKQDELLDSGKYPVLRVGNFFSNRGWYYSDLELDEDKYCENGDLLYAWSASFGPQIWNGDKVIYHYHIWKVLVGSAYNKQFLCKLLEYATESLMGDTHGIAMMHLTKSGMEKTEFIVPPIDLQEQFAAFVEQTDKSKLAVQQGLQELEILKKSLMQEYFE